MTVPISTELHFRHMCNSLLEILVGSANVDQWWSSPNQAFDQRTPEQQWALGSDAVVNYLMFHAHTSGGS